MKRIVIASHHDLAVGMKKTLQFLTGFQEVYAINAYTSDITIEEQIQQVFMLFDEQDEVLIFTDMLGGSVNQKFVPLMNTRVFLICGMNLPVVLTLALSSEGTLTKENITATIEEAKQQLIFMNTYDMMQGQMDNDE